MAKAVEEDLEDYPEMFEKLKSDAETPLYAGEGSDVTISRQRLWALARTNKDGVIDNPRVKEVAEKIDSLSQEVSQGKLPEHEDILARALGTPDHPGRVRGVGFGVTKKQYFGKIKKRTSASSSEVQELREEQAVMKQQLEAQAKLIDMLLKGQIPGRLLGDVSPSGKDSCTVPSDKIPEVMHFLF
ncbi:uncharacterized protein LOC129308904 [Prosopis cineraria]|uniref:uncharacterized protein LOC129308904 n=1 Tax=Prosopis cineraria TaxID=364024 RepID=UPI00240F4ECB|nr:uncharacterized protein LOC129308904 [Prosopis cineraria]